MMLKGSCNCGKVTYAVRDAFEFMGNCHCSQCRKFSGSAFASVGRLGEEDFEITSGEDFLTRYKASAKTIRVFCKNCGASLFVEKPIINKIHLRMGTLDDTPTVRPSFHAHTSSKARWHDITDDLAQYETVPAEM